MCAAQPWHVTPSDGGTHPSGGLKNDTPIQDSHSHLQKPIGFYLLCFRSAIVVSVCNLNSISTANSISNSNCTSNCNTNSNPIVHITYDIISVSLFAIHVSPSPVQGFKGCGCGNPTHSKDCGSVDNGKL